MKQTAAIVAALMTTGIAGLAQAATITVKSDGTTQSVATDQATAALPPGSGLVFGGVIENGQGTGTPLPTGAPMGTEVINIAPGNGQSGFFRSQFVLPVGFSNASISGGANVDDVGTVYLNGTAIGSVSEYADATFASSLAALFQAGTNNLVISDVNSGGGPSGAAYFATITYDAPVTSAVPEPASWAMMIAGLGGVGAALRRRKVAPALA